MYISGAQIMYVLHAQMCVLPLLKIFKLEKFLTAKAETGDVSY